MTADPWTRLRRAVEVHVFLLAGQAAGQTHADALAAAVDYAVAAERAGFAGVWMAEHHFIRYGTCPSAVTFAGYALGRTSTITVGTAAAILSNRHPVALGEEALLLDELSGGRFALGVARGGPWVDLEVFGTGLDRYANGFTESLDLLLRWLSGAQRVAANGERFRFRPVQVVPRPRRRIPVWVAATSTATVDLAARRGLPVLLGMHATDEEKAELLARYAKTAARHGHEGSTVEHASAYVAHVEHDGAKARDMVRDTLPELLSSTGEYVRIDGSPPRHRDLHTYATRLTNLGAVGSPEDCRQRLAATVTATGVRHLLLMVEASGDPNLVVRNIDQLAASLDLPHAPPRPAIAPRR